MGVVITLPPQRVPTSNLAQHPHRGDARRDVGFYSVFTDPNPSEHTMTCRQPHPRSATRHLARSLTHGLTLVEVMCVLAISAVLLGNALPMFTELLARQALLASAALLETDVHLARSEAQRGSQPVRLSVQAVAGGSTCSVVHTGAAHACRCVGGGQSKCDAGARVLRLSEQSGPSGIGLQGGPQSLQFDAGKGTVTPTATLRLVDRDGRAIHQIVNIMGRVRSCTPTGRLGGLRPC